MPDPAFLFAQSLSGLTAAMFLFLIASGLSLIFGVLRVLNFAHGSFYMLGAFTGLALLSWTGNYWLAFFLAPVLVALLAIGVALWRHARTARGAAPAG